MRYEKESKEDLLEKCATITKLTGWGVERCEGTQILEAWGMCRDEGKDKFWKGERGHIMKGLLCQAKESDFLSKTMRN